MFDELVVTKNKDNTYRLAAKGYRFAQGKGELVIHRLKEFPLDISSSVKDEHNCPRTKHMYNQIFNYSLSIETAILPMDDSSTLYTLYIKPKNRRVRNLR